MDYFDLHCDTLTEIYDRKLPLVNDKTAVRASGQFFGKYIQNYAIWTDESRNDSRKRFIDIYKYAIIQFEKYGIKVVKSDNSINNAGNYAVLSAEGCGFAESADDVDMLYEMGFRIISLCWNGKTAFASGCCAEGGLTSKGRQFIERLNKYGIILDVSHLNKQSFYEAAEYADMIMATHSNCSSVNNNIRNLDDDMLKIIRDKNGVVGLCFYPKFLSQNVFEGLYANIEHMLNLNMENCIALGGDFDGGVMSPILDCTECVPVLYRYISKKTGSLKLTDRIFTQNAEKFLTNCIK